jgi:uncharacterized protein YjiS (DUF1127 family)
MEMAMSILSRIHEARVRRLARRDLKALSPELLRDIGIEPEGIDEAVTQVMAAKARNARSHHRAPATPGFSNGDWPYRWGRAG